MCVCGTEGAGRLTHTHNTGRSGGGGLGGLDRVEWVLTGGSCADALVWALGW